MRTTKVLFILLLITLCSRAFADQGSFTNSAGSAVVSSSIIIDSTVASPAGSLTVNCPVTTVSSSTYLTEYDCAGGTFTFFSYDGSTLINAGFASGVANYTCSGGGRGGRRICGYSFSGTINGTLTLNGQTQAIIGQTNQSFGSEGNALTGATGYNSAYSPFYFTNGAQVVRSDDLQGTNLTAFGTTGSDVGQFYGAAGVAVDAAGRIYVADTYNCRVVRMDDINGTNWTTYGTCGSGQDQFSIPQGVFIDSTGKIYVVDTGNYRIVRVDDMNGTNWISYGTNGSGIDQFGSITSVAVDAAAHIYIADTQNARLVRIDDMIGTNWTALTQSPVINSYIYSFQSPSAVTLDPAGRIYVADSLNIIRVDDMTGANWTSVYTGKSNLQEISADSSGTVFAGGMTVTLIEDMTGVVSSTSPVFGNVIGGIAAIPLPGPPPSAVQLSPTSLTFGSLDIGTATTSQPVTVTNFGGSILNISGVEATDGFLETDTCNGSIAPGSTCTISVAFAPTFEGLTNGFLMLTDDSGNSGTAQSVKLNGAGTVPLATQ